MDKPTNPFTTEFDTYIVPGESIECTVGDTTYRARIEHDHDTGIDDTDCWNVDQSVTGCDDTQQAKLLRDRAAFERGDWYFCGVVLSAERDGWVKDDFASLWGIECNFPTDGNERANTYLLEVANQLMSENTECSQ